MKRRNHLAILDAAHNVIPVDTGSLEDLDGDALPRWGKWIEKKENKIVKQESIQGFWISTVFLGVNHGFHGPDRWFETMVFREANDERIGDEVEQVRYATWDEALAGHEVICAQVRNGEIGE